MKEQVKCAVWCHFTSDATFTKVFGRLKDAGDGMFDSHYHTSRSSPLRYVASAWLILILAMKKAWVACSSSQDLVVAGQN